MSPYANGVLLIAAVEDPKTKIWHLCWGQCVNDDGLLCPCQYAICGHHIEYESMFVLPRSVLDEPRRMNKTLARLAPSTPRCEACFVKIAKEKRDE